MKHAITVIVALLLVPATCTIAQENLPAPASNNATLSASDAEILAYMTPAAKQVRKSGLDVFMEPSTSDKFNHADYVVFQMLSTRRCEACSANVGYFAVNKHTADVRQLNEADWLPVTDRELAGIQRIIRKSLGITDEVIKHRQAAPVWK